MASCGTPSAYSKGCRCAECRSAHAERMRAYYHRVGGNKNRKPHHKKSANPPWTEKRREDYQRRRAQKFGTQTEPINNGSVYERDGWVCGICGGSVNPESVYPDPLSPSLDHIEPLSLGGAHTYANVRLTHLRCNVARGNRVAA